jgi:hypothetical protein
MTLEALAIAVIEAAESAGAGFMVVGAMAAGAYGVPRSARDVVPDSKAVTSLVYDIWAIIR